MRRNLADVLIPVPITEEAPATPRAPEPPRARPRPRMPRPRRSGQKTSRRARGLHLSRSRLLAALGSLLCFAMLAAMAYHPYFRIRQVRLQGLVRTPETLLRTWSPLLRLVGRPVILVDTRDLAQRLQEAFPMFRSVQATVEWPNVLFIRVEEREPVLVWEEGGQTFWVDAQGVRFYALGNPDPDWPHVVVQGTAASEVLAPKDVQALLFLARRVAVRPLLYHPRYGYGWQDPDGWPVYLGRDVENLQARWEVYLRVREALKQKHIRPQALRLLSSMAVVVVTEEGKQP